ncbi:MAG: hypothetical protein K6357_07580 [Elusimicrobiota bacterium]
MVILGSFRNISLSFLNKVISKLNYSNRFYKIPFCSIYYLLENEDEIYFDEKLRVGVIFNGELYNFFGQKVANTNISKKIYSMYIENQVFEKKLNGFFKIIIIDWRIKNIILITDRLGFGSMYYSFCDGFFSVSTEFSFYYDFYHNNFVEKQINDKLILDYLVNKIDTSLFYGKTVINNVFCVRPSSKVFLTSKGMFEKKYFIPKLNDKIGSFNPADFKNKSLEFYEILKDTVKARIPQKGSYGIELSGGIDSTSILFVILELIKSGANDRLSILNVYHEDEKGYIDVIDRKLKRYGFSLTKLSYREPDFEKVVRLLLISSKLYTSYNFLSSSIILKEGKEMGINVMFDGDGPDEMMGGYENKYFNLYLMDYYKEFGLKAFLKEYKFYKEKLFNFNPTLKYSKNISDLLFRIDYMRRSQIDRFAEKILSQPYKGYFNDDLVMKTLTSSFVFDTYYQIAVGSGMEFKYRRPYLDNKVIDFIFSLPVCYKIHNGVGKYILKSAIRSRIPLEIICREKFGGMVNYNFVKNFLLNNKNIIFELIKDGYVSKYIVLKPLIKNFRWLIDNKNPHIILRVLNIELILEALNKKSFYKKWVE